MLAYFASESTLIERKKEMEPMALGSPPSSPSTSPANPNYLPAFLLGDTQTSSPRTNPISPAKTRTVSFKATSPVSEPRLLHHRYYAQSPQEQHTSFNISAINEKTGPPARGLFDTFDTVGDYSRQQNITSPTKEIDQSTRQLSTPQRGNYSRNLSESLNRSYRRPLDSSESLWVTVLGFPPHAASLVLSQFAQCGTIIDKKFPAEGNWVDLKYSSELEVAKALSFNGKLISNCIMVGVIPCNNYENKENAINLNESVGFTSPNRARPLVQSPGLKNSVADIMSPQNVPQKSTGLVSKAMEYVFGW